MRTPFEVKREADDVHYTYLDTSGRPVVVLRKPSLLEQHIQDFEVSLCHLGVCSLSFLEEKSIYLQGGVIPEPFVCNSIISGTVAGISNVM